MATIEVGAVIASKYRVERQLSRGGMGALWVARQLQLQRLVAIKVMEPSLAATAEGRMRFEREARAAALIQSPHVVQIHDYGVERDTPYIVMELLEGEDLGRRLKRERRLSLPALARIFAEITRALRKAHDAGMIHLDLKPANIFLARDDEDEIVKVLDFGIAKMTNLGAATEATSTGVMLGSANYMSPEQVRGRRGLDHRSDLWSLGVIAFRAITGELPFVGTQVGDVLVKVCTDPIPRGSSVFPGLGPEVDAFLLRALDRDPDARFQSARELSTALTLLAWPGDQRPPLLSITAEPAVLDAVRAGPGPAAAFPRPAQPGSTGAHVELPLATAGAPWPLVADAGTLASTPRTSAPLGATSRGSTPDRAWKSAALAVMGIVGALAAASIGWITCASRRPPTTIQALTPQEDEPPAATPALPAAAPQRDIAPAPDEAKAPFAAPSAPPTPAPSPSLRAPIKPCSPSSAAPAPRKKPNPELGF